VQHNWIIFALGRRCPDCDVTQENGAFNDDVPCGSTQAAPARRSPRPQKPQKPEA
jgi:hypothetical protein